MENITQGIAFCGCIFAFAGVIFSFMAILNDFKMKRENQKLNTYIKDKTFLRMKNAGGDPCDAVKEFEMPEFSQDCNYLLRRTHQ